MDFHFLVLEKSWKILFGKEWSPCENDKHRLQIVTDVIRKNTKLVISSPNS